MYSSVGLCILVQHSSSRPLKMYHDYRTWRERDGETACWAVTRKHAASMQAVGAAFSHKNRLNSENIRMLIYWWHQTSTLHLQRVEGGGSSGWRTAAALVFTGNEMLACSCGLEKGKEADEWNRGGGGYPGLQQFDIEDIFFIWMIWVSSQQHLQQRSRRLHISRLLQTCLIS